MMDPIRALMLATLVAFVAGVVVDTSLPQYSAAVLEIGASGFIITMTVLMLAGARKV